MADTFIPVLIVGAGPTGLTVANLLGLYGIHVLLIEQHSSLSNLPRAVTIDDEGLRICQMLGLRSEVLEHVRLNLGAAYFSHGRLLMRLTPTLASQQNGYPPLSTFAQPLLEATLLTGLQRFPNVEVRFGHTFETLRQAGQEVLACIRTPTGQMQQIACAYLLACDGGKSSVRRTLQISLRGTTFPQRWLVVDGLCKEQAPASHVSFFSDSWRPVVSIPTPGLSWRWEFMLHPCEDESWFLVPTHLRHLLQKIGDQREVQIARQSIYTVHAACASTFTAGRVFLLGDAAHLLPPFGGQGMNCGLRDACNLAWKLALVLKNQANSGLLATYQQERAPHAAQMLRYASFLSKIVLPTGRLRTELRDLVLRVLPTLPLIASPLNEMRVKPKSVYRHGFRGSDGSRVGAASAGQLLPQPVASTAHHAPVLLDELLGHGFALLRLHAHPGEAFKPLQADLWQKLKPRYICIAPTTEQRADTSHDDLYTLDNQKFARLVHARGDLILLVRPDRYIYGAFHVDKERYFVTALQKQLFG